MKSLFFSFIFSLIVCNVWAANDFSVSTRYKNSVVSAYYTFTEGSGINYKTHTRYGLYNEAKNEWILPMKYQYVWISSEEDIFYIKDTLGYWGMYNIKTKNQLLPNEYNEIKQFADGLAILSKKFKDGSILFGAADKNGKIIIPLEYKNLSNISEDYICFSKDNGYGFIDKKNKIIIPAIYRSPSKFSQGLACVSLLDSTKYGYIDKNMKWVIPPTYLRGGDFVGNFALVFTNRNYNLNSDQGGIIDKTGKIIVPLKYDNITITDNFFIAKELSKTGYFTNTNYGIIDHNGQTILPFVYTDISKKPGTEYYQAIKDLKYELIDKNAKIVTKEPYDYIYSFTDFGITYLKKNNKYTIIDKSLQVIIPERGARDVVFGKKNKLALLFPDKVEIFNASGTLVKTIVQENVASYGTEFKNEDDSITLKYAKSVHLYDISTKNKQLLDYTDVGEFDENGIFLAKKSTLNYVDYTGKKLNPKQYESALNFTDGIAVVKETAYSAPLMLDKNFATIKNIGSDNIFEGPFSEGLAKGKTVYGFNVLYFDKKGNSFKIQNASDGGAFHNGRAYIKDYYAGRYYFIDKSGKKIDNNLYDAVSNFSENICVVRNGTKIGFIDTTGKLIIPYKYDLASSFENGKSMVKEGDVYYMINSTGKKINNEVYNGAYDPTDGFYPVKKDDKYGIVDANGKTIIDFKYQDISSLQDGVAWAKKEGKWGLITAKKELTPFVYDLHGECKNGYTKASTNGKLSLLDYKGNIVIAPQYERMSNVYKNKILLIKSEGKLVKSTR